MRGAKLICSRHFCLRLAVEQMNQSGRRSEMAFFTLTIARHGETSYNKDRLIQGQMDIPLSVEGKRQSLLLGQRLKDEIFTHVYTSELCRAIQTAECILESNHHPTPEIMRDERLGERKFGEMEGKPFKLMVEMAKKSGLTIGAFTPLGAETTAQVRQRAASFFGDLCSQLIAEDESQTSLIGNKMSINEYKEEHPTSVLVVSHGGFINEFVLHLIEDLKCQVPNDKMKALVKFSPNASFSKFVVSVKAFSRPRISCHYFYDREHLNDTLLFK